MTDLNFGQLVARHRTYFLAGSTRPMQWREEQLTALRTMITERSDDFHAAMWKDLRRNRIDADLVDVKHVADEAAYALIPTMPG